jgi:hypothetical protein
MILPEDVYYPFVILLDNLARYTQAQTGLLEDSEPGVDFDNYEQFKLIEAASQNPDIVEGYITGFSGLVPPDALELMGQLRHLWTAEALPLRYAPNGNLIVYTDAGLFEICGLSQEISTVLPKLLQPQRMTFCPVGDIITYAMHIADYPVLDDPGFAQLVNNIIEKSRNMPVISSAAEFVRVVDQYKAAAREAEFDQLAHDIERDSLKAQGKEPLPDGVNRGALAGLSWDERKVVVDGDFDQKFAPKLDDFALCIWKSEAAHGNARRSLNGAIKDLTPAELDTACMYVSPDCEPVQPDELAACIQSEQGLLEFMKYLPPNHFDFFATLAEEGGSMSVAEDDASTLLRLFQVRPFVNVYYEEQRHRFKVFVDARVAELACEIMPEACREQERLQQLTHAAKFAVQLYGVLPMERFVQLYADMIDQQVDAKRVSSELENYIIHNDFGCDYEIDYVDGQACLLADEVGSQQFFELGEDVPDGLTQYREYILRRQNQIGLRAFDSGWIYTSFYFDWILKLESAQNLASWLDAHVPDGEDDLSFADRVIEELFDETRGPFDQQEARDELLAHYENAEGDEDMLNDLLALASRFISDVPRWENAGYSALEQAERETGKKIFYNPDGRPAKVGRNDPCPCGSGKKYKKCHGR